MGNTNLVRIINHEYKKEQKKTNVDYRGTKT
jgi:hypothetical protein